MIDVEDLVALVRNYNPRTNADLIRRAYAYARQMHDGHFRKSGEPYFTHPVAVAAILTEQRLDDATHRHRTPARHDRGHQVHLGRDLAMFSPEIADLVDGVTKLTNLQLSSTETQQAENSASFSWRCRATFA